ncbi:PREDICTED: synapse-associated protein 1 [Propithecus coquereli]|uniref:synapse-associated protein 1 n=1 Tax=Propithecus coquereli TaxID=379532 RepID=UPI00063EE32A|nr:PREDICTED: synapse-associated protein 1 [Propithecus coquereli]
MFRDFSVWLGLQQPAAGGGQSEGEWQAKQDAPAEQQSETVAEPAEEEREEAGDRQLLHQAKGLGRKLTLWFGFVKVKTIIGDFQKEQKKFVEEQHTKKSEAAVPPWIDSNDEETIQQQILALSADKRNFLRDPPAGVQFNFEFDQMYPVALVMLQEDELLSRMRFSLVPKLVKEEVFWRNYFYRVSLIKQSAQLTALAAQQQAAEREEKGNSRQEDSPLTEAVRPKTPPVVIKSQLKTQEDEEEISTSPGVSEFVSDAFDACNLNQEDLRKEMEQLVLDKKQEKTAVLEEDSADWEKELQQELQEYEVVTESEKRDENWDKEIEKMLQEEN